MTTAAPSPGVVPWWVVVPLKDTRMGKSRIRVDPTTRQALARAMAHDTVSAVLDAGCVDRVVLVCEDPDDAQMIEHYRVLVHLDRSRRGLNPAIAAGAALARSLDPGCHLAVLPADLPALTGAVLDRALRLATAHPWAFVADQDGVGTTLLTARRGRSLEPHYGPHSRARHAASGAVELTDPALDALRRDVDDLDTLCAVTVALPDRHTARAVAPDLCPVGSR